MNSFVNAVVNEQNKVVKVRTTNGAKAFSSTGEKVLDYFSKVGGLRGRVDESLKLFINAINTDEELAVRALLWTRDVRGGAGEREAFRNILKNLAVTNYKLAERIALRVPELGRWDDLLVLFGTPAESVALSLIKDGLESQNGLCAKWMPRKGKDAEKLRAFLEYSPKRYRKTLVTLTNVVEQKMCAKEWDEINFSHVPSKAAIVYREAFKRNTQKYNEWLQSLVKGEVKVNASALYPHEVVKMLNVDRYNESTSETVMLANAQWEALPNFMPEDASVLPMIDVSGSMSCPAGQNTKVTCMDVAIGLGLYCATKNTGAFKDLWLTFSEHPSMEKLVGTTLSEKVSGMNMSNWEMSTNLEAAFARILKTAVSSKADPKDMPKTLLIFSDMQFDCCVSSDKTLLKIMKQQYKEAGYEIPKVVFWNLNDYGNSPAKATSNGVALVSGFSPSLMEAVLNDDLQSFTPLNVMLKVLSAPRYDF